MNKLLDWKDSSYRKTLILKGVRQVGKTRILKEFGRRYYENTAYFNFDENEQYKQFFEDHQGCRLYSAKYNDGQRSKDRAGKNLSFLTRCRIVPRSSTLCNIVK